MKGRVVLSLAGALLALSALPVVVTNSWGQSSDAPQVQKVAYKVVDGNKVDNDTLLGWKTWRALACERCHGAKQEGLVGPSLIDAFKTLDKNEFHRTV
ncbi:MAG TPA: methanol dehydrogenase, partial [Paraburkholderia sp.]|nr:methanol dehydrogenase [Paraburkholderia sp.]